MINRSLKKDIEDALHRYPVVGIVGPRQVGKTTLVKSIMKNIPGAQYIDLELPSDFYKLDNAQLYLESLTDKVVVIDEIQKKPELFPLLRSLIDKKRKPGKYIILGSTQPALVRKASESLAGRIKYLELNPFSVIEISRENISLDSIWLRGGFPLSLLRANDADSMDWRQNFIQTYIERDIPQFGFQIPATNLRRFWTMAAHVHGQLLNSSMLAGSMGLTNKTIKGYIDLLSDLFLIRQLSPFHTNVKKRLIKTPKIYYRDTGLLHALLRINDYNELLSNPVLGHSWEGFIIEQVICNLRNTYNPYFYRTRAGAEIDLLLTRAEIPQYAIEIKFSSTPKIQKGLLTSMADLNIKKGFVLYPGEDEYPVSQYILAVPAKKFILNIEEYLITDN